MPKTKSFSNKLKRSKTRTNKIKYNKFLKGFNQYCDLHKRYINTNHITFEFSMYYEGWNFPVGFTSYDCFKYTLKTAKKILSKVGKKQTIKTAEHTIKQMVDYSKNNYDLFKTGKKIIQYTEDELLKIWLPYIQSYLPAEHRGEGSLQYLSNTWHTSIAILLEAGHIRTDDKNGWYIKVDNKVVGKTRQCLAFV